MPSEHPWFQMKMRETANFQAPAKAVSLLLFAILRIFSRAARLSS